MSETNGKPLPTPADAVREYDDASLDCRVAEAAYKRADAARYAASQRLTAAHRALADVLKELPGQAVRDGEIVYHLNWKDHLAVIRPVPLAELGRQSDDEPTDAEIDAMAFAGAFAEVLVLPEDDGEAD